MKIVGWVIFIGFNIYAYIINRDFGVNTVSPIFRAIFPWVGGAFLVFMIGYVIRQKIDETAPERAARKAEREKKAERD